MRTQVRSAGVNSESIAQYPPAPRPPAPQSQKQQLRSQLDVASKARENARTSMKELRSSVKFTKGEALFFIFGLEPVQ